MQRGRGAARLDAGCASQGAARAGRVPPIKSRDRAISAATDKNRRRESETGLVPPQQRPRRYEVTLRSHPFRKQDPVYLCPSMTSCVRTKLTHYKRRKRVLHRRKTRRSEKIYLTRSCHVFDDHPRSLRLSRETPANSSTDPIKLPTSCPVGPVSLHRTCPGSVYTLLFRCNWTQERAAGQTPPALHPLRALQQEGQGRSGWTRPGVLRQQLSAARLRRQRARRAGVARSLATSDDVDSASGCRVGSAQSAATEAEEEGMSREPTRRRVRGACPTTPHALLLHPTSMVTVA